MITPERLQSLPRVMGAALPNVIPALPNAFERVGPCRDVEQPLIRGCVLHHGGCLAVDGKYDWPFCLSQALQKRSRVIAKRR
jgi:hypothetical protein